MRRPISRQYHRSIVSAICGWSLCIVGVITLATVFLYIGLRAYIDDRNDKATNDVESYVSDEIKRQTIVRESTIELKPDVIYTRSVAISDTFTNFQLMVEPVLQYPELPTGCEVTALATVLKFYGFDVDKLDLAKNYLPMGNVGEVSPYDAFIGNPESPHGYGCYAPVIKKTAENYLSSLDWLKVEMGVWDVTGATMYELEQYLVDGNPVMLWASMDMVKTKRNDGWIINGEEVYWRYNEHCLVLIGFTETEYIFADPLNGIKSYEKGLVNQRYGELGQQAVVIY